MEVFDFKPGTAPLLMSIPHVGETIPDDIGKQLAPIAEKIGDTDWYLDRLYNFAEELGVSILKSNYSRYVIDLNRAPDSRPLYPGASNTELLPTSTFLEEPLYDDGNEPDTNEITRRLETYWVPYHQRIQEALSEIRDRFGYAVLFDCHSIKSVLPRFFEGKLPDLNLGTAEGTSCDPELRDRLAGALTKHIHYSLAVDGRFKGGYITRQYGAPKESIHSFQLELSIATYMDEDPNFHWREDLADQVRPSLRRMLEAACNWVPAKIK